MDCLNSILCLLVSIIIWRIRHRTPNDTLPHRSPSTGTHTLLSEEDDAQDVARFEITTAANCAGGRRWGRCQCRSGTDCIIHCAPCHLYSAVYYLRPSKYLKKVFHRPSALFFAVNNMVDAGLEGVDFFVCNTDAQALMASNCEQRILLGDTGLGAGAKPEIG